MRPRLAAVRRVLAHRAQHRARDCDLVRRGVVVVGGHAFAQVRADVGHELRRGRAPRLVQPRREDHQHPAHHGLVSHERPARVRPIGRQHPRHELVHVRRAQPLGELGLERHGRPRALVHRERGIRGIVVGGRRVFFSAVGDRARRVRRRRRSRHGRARLLGDRIARVAVLLARALHRPRPHRAGTLWHDGSATRSHATFSRVR